jgi:putative NADH-flavin reductase
MNVLVLGASGKSGLRTVERALKAGHKVTAYLRNDTNMSEETKKNPNLTVCFALDNSMILLVCCFNLVDSIVLSDPSTQSAVSTTGFDASDSTI